VARKPCRAVTVEITAHPFLSESSVFGFLLVPDRVLDGKIVEGILMTLVPNWPDDLPYAVAEISTERDINFITFVHNMTDLHASHGESVYNLSTSAHISEGPSECKSFKSFLSMPTPTELLDAVKKLNDERAKRAADLNASEPAARVVPTQLQHSSALRAAMSKGSAAASSATTRSGPAPSAPNLRGGRGGGRGHGSSAAAGRRKRQGGSTTIDGPSLPSAAASRSGSLPRARGGSTAATSILDDPPSAAKGASKKSSASAVGAGGRASVAGRDDTKDSAVKLGGVRGLSKVVTVEEILAGYNAGRELAAAEKKVDDLHAERKAQAAGDLAVLCACGRAAMLWQEVGGIVKRSNSITSLLAGLQTLEGEKYTVSRAAKLLFLNRCGTDYAAEQKYEERYRGIPHQIEAQR
jgi:hypothetical protein